MEDIPYGLNLIVYKTWDIFDQYGISVKDVPANLHYSVIDLDKYKVVESFRTKKDAIEYITMLTLRVYSYKNLTKIDYN